MDIQYLLFLQGLREATGGTFNEFFNAISKIAVDVMPFLTLYVFWCLNKKWGYRYIATLRTGEVINGIIKLTVCAYRPWIRSASIEPACDGRGGIWRTLGKFHCTFSALDLRSRFLAGGHKEADSR